MTSLGSVSRRTHIDAQLITVPVISCVGLKKKMLANDCMRHVWLFISVICVSAHSVVAYRVCIKCMLSLNQKMLFIGMHRHKNLI